MLPVEDYFSKKGEENSKGEKEDSKDKNEYAHESSITFCDQDQTRKLLSENKAEGRHQKEKAAKLYTPKNNENKYLVR